ncbi:hypothetical protein PAXRUDRAFT_142643 [Paxillus rubicundulus Ve08.2h10]|uniref:Uncharacterized protein n=1 Tax=Paxillus rubicundulus Ve08.2h10 TaxID=930991 RepID=A0A0D0DQC6_9AGAM|nr:hypothetical protein PAXRUDRAFT_142643 [Paxillus rubicundulus Ve08.2h10]
MPAVAIIFAPSVAGHNASTELVIFVCEVGQAVAITYPVSKNSGEQVVVTGLQAWLHCHNGCWECFCTLVTDKCAPVRFVTDLISGHQMALCHHQHNQYGSSHMYLSLVLILTT